MNGCRFEERSFTVACHDHRSDKATCACGNEISGLAYKRNGEKLCRDCWNKIPDKDGFPGVDNFIGYYDQSLGTKITSVRQKVRLLEKKGLHYSEDNPAFRERRQLAESYLGKDGKRKLDSKARKEFTKITQEIAHRKYEE